MRAGVMAMRTVLLALLLAGAASPALAAGDGGPWGHGNRGDRGEQAAQSSDNGDNEARPRRAERAAPHRENVNVNANSNTPNEPRQGMVRQRQFEGGPAMEQGGPRAFGGQFHRPQQQPPVEMPAAEPQRNVEAKVIHAPRARSQGFEERNVGRGGGARFRTVDDQPAVGGSSIEERNMRHAPGVMQNGGLVEQRRDTPHVFQNRERRISRTPVFGTEPPAPRTATVAAARPSHHWQTSWRNDHRYDWQNWRRHHRSSFRLGFYYDPFGWDYLRYGVGWRMWPSYYRSSFWLNDPWQYRLPPVYGPYRWIRYFDDALLVNIYTGEVVDIEYDFFWS